MSRTVSDRAANIDEIEVTPEMIEAGVDLFYDLPELLGPSPEQLRDTIKRAFLVMLQVQQQARKRPTTR